MSAGILELDKGMVIGSTWHNLPQYICVDRPITLQEAMDIMDYPLEKQQLFRWRTGAVSEAPKPEKIQAWCIVRTDHNTVLVPHVGNRFDVINNKALLNRVDAGLLQVYPELQIESVGTLWNGATAFINIKLDEFQIKGDKSPTVSRLMYYNPLGAGAYKACAHDVRIVCNNTLKMAEVEGLANKTLKKIRHTATAADKIKEHLVDLAEVQMHLKKHIEELTYLTLLPVTEQEIKIYLDQIIPIPTHKSHDPSVADRARTIAINKRELIRANMENEAYLEGDITRSRYALLQATTQWLDHNVIKGGDKGALAWDSLVGARSNLKATAFNTLLKM